MFDCLEDLESNDPHHFVDDDSLEDDLSDAALLDLSELEEELSLEDLLDFPVLLDASTICIFNSAMSS